MTVFKTMKMAGIAASLVVSACVAKVEAVSIPILNHSFESPVPAAGATWMDGVPTNWTGVGEELDGGLYTWIEDSASLNFTGGDGPQHGGIGEDDGYLYQDLGVPFQANRTYTIDLAGAHRSGTTHSLAEFGLFSSSAIGTDIGTPGFIDIQAFWDGSGNPDADNMFDVFRDASDLQRIDLNGDNIESLGRTYTFDTGSTPPTGNIVIFIRQAALGNGDRIQYDNIRLDESPSVKKGDVDLDGDVDINDLSPIRTNFRTSVGSRGLGDLNDDGYVDFSDYLEWHGNFPSAGGGASAAIPEPASWILGLAAGLLAIGGRRQRRHEHD